MRKKREITTMKTIKTMMENARKSGRAEPPKGTKTPKGEEE
jgi:hypothetical protein